MPLSQMFLALLRSVPATIVGCIAVFVAGMYGLDTDPPPSTLHVDPALLRAIAFWFVSGLIATGLLALCMYRLPYTWYWTASVCMLVSSLVGIYIFDWMRCFMGGCRTSTLYQLSLILLLVFAVLIYVQWIKMWSRLMKV